MDVQIATAETVKPTLLLQLPMKMLLGLEHVLQQENWSSFCQKIPNNL